MVICLMGLIMVIFHNACSFDILWSFDQKLTGSISLFNGSPQTREETQPTQLRAMRCTVCNLRITICAPSSLATLAFQREQVTGET